MAADGDMVVDQLIERSHRLGSDPRNTNYAGGNASAKGTDVDPVTGEDVELLWVKGSGGDLGTLTRSGLAVLRLDRLRALAKTYAGVDREDEMVAAFDFCLHGKGGAATSIETAMHGLVAAQHVDGYGPLPEAARRARAAALAPVIRGLASTDGRQVGHFTDADAVLDFLARAEHPRLAALGTSCPDHFLRTKVRPLVLDQPATAPLEETVERLRALHAAYRDEYRAYYERHASPDSPPMRGADPAIVLVPGVGMFS